MAGYRPGDPFNRVIQYLGLSSGLKLCLDSGDIASWPGSGQKWLDTSGGGNDFFLGLTGSSASDDPTFTGTAGRLSANEYWAMDTNDIFTYDTTNTSWMTNIHSNGAIFTILSWIYITSYGAGNSAGVCGTLGAGTIGFLLRLNSATGALNFQTQGSSTLTQFVSTGTALALNAWNLVGISITENGGAGAGQFYINGATNGAAFNPNYTTPSTAIASNTMKVADVGNNTRQLGINGAARMGFIGIWEGVTLSSNQISNFYNYSAPFLDENFGNFITLRDKKVTGY